MKTIQPITKFLRCIEPANFEPVTLDEAKLYAKVENDDEDYLLTNMISAVRQYAESQTNRVLRASIWEWAIEGNLASDVNVPIAPCSACNKILVDGVEIDESLYEFIASGNGASETPLLAGVKPLIGFPLGRSTHFEIMVGWEKDNIPESIKNWMLVRISTLYVQREIYVAGTNIKELSHDFVDGMLDPFRIPRGL